MQKVVKGKISYSSEGSLTLRKYIELVERCLVCRDWDYMVRKANQEENMAEKIKDQLKFSKSGALFGLQGVGQGDGRF
ncbi:hypothetical protein VNO78_27573 [Psophocarpus tetragonolobus]|uniref:Uncharacterized protein n=1 Tax=Psophocarpus tetragonolobus TaxID=3891 RepID=A0AAN9XBG0_PSOTE